MNRYKLLLPAILAVGLFSQQTSHAAESAEACVFTPYVGVCPQGCDAAAPTEQGSVFKENVDAAIQTTQIDCNNTPYIGPLCGEGQ